MAVVLFVVKASITPEQEEAFNRWYNEEHCPQLLQFRGAVSARRYKAILGEDEHQYMAVYEFESEATFQRFLKSGHLEELRLGPGLALRQERTARSPQRQPAPLQPNQGTESAALGRGPRAIVVAVLNIRPSRR
jgi:heme-degrading monooxygenase HmoA